MAKKIIARNLNTQARAEFIVNGGNCLCKKSDIMALSQRIEKLINIKSEATQEERQERHNWNQHNGNSHNNRSEATANSSGSKKKGSNHLLHSWESQVERMLQQQSKQDKQGRQLEQQDVNEHKKQGIEY